MQEKLDTLDDDNRAIETILSRVNASARGVQDQYETKGAAPSSSKFAKSLKKMQGGKGGRGMQGDKGKKRDFKGASKGAHKSGPGNKRQRTIWLAPFN